jgi:hypothetical protein
MGPEVDCKAQNKTKPLSLEFEAHLQLQYWQFHVHVYRTYIPTYLPTYKLGV